VWSSGRGGEADLAPGLSLLPGARPLREFSDAVSRKGAKLAKREYVRLVFGCGSDREVGKSFFGEF
jgi:hypothetical protein